MEDLFDNAVKIIAPEEGLKQHIYVDTKGNQTIGWGHLVSNGFSRAVCSLMLKEDLDIAINGCIEKIDFFKKLSIPRQVVFVSMAFNMGIGGLLGFHKMLAYCKAEEWDNAANEMESSLEFKEVPDRLYPLIKIMRTNSLGT